MSRYAGKGHTAPCEGFYGDGGSCRDDSVYVVFPGHILTYVRGSNTAKSSCKQHLAQVVDTVRGPRGLYVSVAPAQVPGT